MRILGVALAAAEIVTVSHAAAQSNYPEKPIRVVVGFPPGSQADIVARTRAPPPGRMTLPKNSARGYACPPKKHDRLCVDFTMTDELHFPTIAGAAELIRTRKHRDCMEEPALVFRFPN